MPENQFPDTPQKETLDSLAKRLIAFPEPASRILALACKEFQGMAFAEIAKLIQSKSRQGVKADSVPLGLIDTKEGESHDDGTETRFDVYIEPVLPDGTVLCIDIEVQNDSTIVFLAARSLYYKSRTVSRQKGRLFLNSNYGQLKKVYSIWIWLNPPKGEVGSITEVRLAAKRRYPENSEVSEEMAAAYDRECVVILALPPPNLENIADDGLNFLSVILAAKISAAKKREFLEAKGIHLEDAFLEDLDKMCTLDESVRRESKIEGKEEQRREDVISLLEAGLAVEFIAKTLKTSVETIEKIKQSMFPNKRFA